MGECQPEAQVNGFAGSMIIALLCSKYEARLTEVSISQMYKVFFNDRTIYLDDTLPDMTKVGKDYVCAFENITDLKPQIKQFLDPEKKGNLHIFHDDQESLFKIFKQCFTNINAGGGLVRNSKGEILLIFRRGKWDLPKGKTEEGESIEQTAIREVQEECGLDGVELRDFLMSTYHIFKDSLRLVLKRTDWYSMHYPGNSKPKPQKEEDITDVRWLKPSGLDEIYSNTFLSVKDILEAGH
ncbi:MAG TPA: NUDIX domain-containing protein [Bacteroides sp.]|nr:NUDIX domain-containing protein [Bacteroides sp.]